MILYMISYTYDIIYEMLAAMPRISESEPGTVTVTVTQAGTRGMMALEYHGMVTGRDVPVTQATIS